MTMTIQGTHQSMRRDARWGTSRTAGVHTLNSAEWGLGGGSNRIVMVSQRAGLGKPHRTPDAAAGSFTGLAVPRLALEGEAVPSQGTTRRREASLPLAGVFQVHATGSLSSRGLACGVEYQPDRTVLETRSIRDVRVGRPSLRSKADGPSRSTHRVTVTSRHPACSGGSPAWVFVSTPTLRRFKSGDNCSITSKR